MGFSATWHEYIFHHKEDEKTILELGEIFGSAAHGHDLTKKMFEGLFDNSEPPLNINKISYILNPDSKDDSIDVDMVGMDVCDLWVILINK